MGARSATASPCRRPVGRSAARRMRRRRCRPERWGPGGRRIHHARRGVRCGRGDRCAAERRHRGRTDVACAADPDAVPRRMADGDDGAGRAGGVRAVARVGLPELPGRPGASTRNPGVCAGGRSVSVRYVPRRLPGGRPRALRAGGGGGGGRRARGDAVCDHRRRHGGGHVRHDHRALGGRLRRGRGARRRRRAVRRLRGANASHPHDARRRPRDRHAPGRQHRRARPFDQRRDGGARGRRGRRLHHRGRRDRAGHEDRPRGTRWGQRDDRRPGRS